MQIVRTTETRCDSREQLTKDDGASERTVEPATVEVAASEKPELPYDPERAPWRSAAASNAAGPLTDLRVCRTESADQASGAHQHHRHHQSLASPTPIRVAAEEPTADRTHDEANGEDTGNVQKARIPSREEGVGEIKREDGVEIERVQAMRLASDPAITAVSRWRKSALYGATRPVNSAGKDIWLTLFRRSYAASCIPAGNGRSPQTLRHLP